MQSGYAVVDLEMTGADHLRGLIIEIAVGISGSGRKLITDRVLVKIDRPLPKRIVKLTGITDRELVSGGVAIDNALAWFVEKTSGLSLVGHNIIRGDRPYLLEAARKHRQTVEEGLYPKLSIDEVRDLSVQRFIDTAGLYKGYKLGEYVDDQDLYTTVITTYIPPRQVGDAPWTPWYADYYHPAV